MWGDKQGFGYVKWAGVPVTIILAAHVLRQELIEKDTARRRENKNRIATR